MPHDNPANVLHELATASAHLSAAERRDFFWASVGKLERTLREQLRNLAAAEPYLEQVTVYVDDPSYRQGAATVILEFRFSPDDDFTLGASCLVDHGKILLRVTRPGAGLFDALRTKLEQRGENALR